MRWLLVLLTLTGPMRADEPGEFDYYVMSLSWQPSWCAGEGQGAEACARELGFVLHGLWPQYEEGWPEWCARTGRDPSRAETGAMADIMGSGGLAWHQWRKHGRCTGLSYADYFALSREAYGSVERPEVLRRVEEALRLDPLVIEEAFLEANPDLAPDGITITCRDGRIQEARICLTRSLEPRTCGADVIRDCRATATLPPID